jgi:hypothetical protein
VFGLGERGGYVLIKSREKEGGSVAAARTVRE